MTRRCRRSARTRAGADDGPERLARRDVVDLDALGRRPPRSTSTEYERSLGAEVLDLAVGDDLAAVADASTASIADLDRPRVSKRSMARTTTTVSTIPTTAEHDPAGAGDDAGDGEAAPAARRPRPGQGRDRQRQPDDRGDRPSTTTNGTTRWRRRRSRTPSRRRPGRCRPPAPSRRPDVGASGSTKRRPAVDTSAVQTSVVVEAVLEATRRVGIPPARRCGQLVTSKRPVAVGIPARSRHADRRRSLGRWSWC